MTITVARTIQLHSYEPVTITVSEVVELDDDDDKVLIRNEAYKSISASVTKYLNHQVSKTTKD